MAKTQVRVARVRLNRERVGLQRCWYLREGRVVSDVARSRATDDERIERWFVFDYAAFSLQMNFRDITTLLEGVRAIANDPLRKSLCVSCMQLLWSSYEDFAILLDAIVRRRDGAHLHCTLGVEPQTKRGSTGLPRVLKRFTSAREFLDNLGFTSVTPQAVRSPDADLPEDHFEQYFNGFADSVRILDDYKNESTHVKNRLKHGKGIRLQT